MGLDRKAGVFLEPLAPSPSPGMWVLSPGWPMAGCGSGWCCGMSAGTPGSWEEQWRTGAFS